MTRFLGMTFGFFLLASCGVQSGPTAPMASVKVPLCVAAPATVLFDASGTIDADGDIARYIFQIGHRNAALVVEVPRVTMHFSHPYRIGGIYQPMPVSVTVVDATGLEGTVTTQFWVVQNQAECADIGSNTPDVWSQDAGDDTLDVAGFGDLDDDVASPDASQEVKDAEVRDVADMAQETSADVSDVAPDSLEDLPDLFPTDVAPDSFEACPTLGNNYTVKIRCNGAVEALLDLEIKQLGCTVSDTFGVVSGGMQGKTLTMESTFTELKIEQCSGLVEQVELFTLECANGCTSEYTLKP